MPSPRLLGAFTALLAIGSLTLAEQPSWQEISGDAYLIRTHWWDPLGERTDGIWRLDSETGASTRLRPFHYYTKPDSVFEHHQDGRASYLSANGDLLVFQAWPYYVDFEAASWRILRRYPPIADQAAAGWAVRGAIVSEEEAPLLGLEPGVYGFALCMRPILCNFGAVGCGNVCDPLSIPGYPDLLWYPYDQFDNPVLIRRGLAPDDGAITFVAELEAHDYYSGDDFTFPMPSVLSFDTRSGGMWRGTRRGVEFLPVCGGAFCQPSLSLDFDFPPFADPQPAARSLCDRPAQALDPGGEEGGVVLSTLLFHPVRRLFLGASLGSGFDNDRFFSIDERFDLVQTYEVATPPAVGAPSGLPVTLAALGPLPERHEQMLPIVTHTPGLHSTVWTSTAWLYNPSSEAVTVEVRRVVAPDVRRQVELGPHASVQLPDVLAWAGGGPAGDGVAHDALVLTSPYRWGEQVVAASRTSTPASAAGHPGSYGQAVVAVPGRLGYSNHLQLVENWTVVYYNVTEQGQRAAHFDLDRLTPGRYRHNLGVVNDHPEPLHVTLVWGWDDAFERMTWDERPPETIRSLEVAARDVEVFNLESLFPESVQTSWAPRVAVFADRPAAIWLSMVDNSTGDATFVPFTAFHWRTDADDNRAAIPVVTHSSGTDGTRWVTDVYAIQGNAWHPLDDNGYDRPRAILHPAEPATACGGYGVQGEILVDLQGQTGPPGSLWDPGDAVVFPDVVRLFPPCAQDTEVSGGLEVVTASWTTGYSRTYTTREDGGTYGEMLPFYPINGWPVQHFAGVEVSDEFRVNVGLFNGDHGHAIAQRLTLYAADGSLAAERTLTLQPLASYQRSLDHIFGLEDGTLPQGTYGLTVLPLDDDAAGVQGHCWAYVSLVDNTTGDPTNWW